MTQMMRALVARTFGDPGAVLTLCDLPVPTPPPAAALVRVHATGVNFADAMLLRGGYQVKPSPPFVAGVEVAGEVAACGAGSVQVVGARVAAQVLGFGACSEFTIVEDRRALRVPQEWSWEEAAAFPVASITAELALDAANELRAGDTVVVHAAAGAVGLAAVALAKMRQCLVIALASTEERRAIATAQGADHVLGSRTSDWWRDVLALTGDRGADAIVDPVGGDVSLASLRCLAWRGCLAVVGFAGGTPAQLPANRLLAKAQTVQGIYWAYGPDDERLARVQRKLELCAAAGHLRPTVARTYPLSEGAQAFLEAEAGSAGGKLAIRVSER